MLIGQAAAPAPGLPRGGNRFIIKTNAPNVKVSWQVTGIRQDAFANKHRIPVEEEKPIKERGAYLHPDAFEEIASHVSTSRTMNRTRRVYKASVNLRRPAGTQGVQAR